MNKKIPLSLFILFFITPALAQHLTKEQRQEYYSDILAEDAHNVQGKALYEPKAATDYGLRVVESWLTEDGKTMPPGSPTPYQDWVILMKEPPFPLKKTKLLDGFEFQLEHQHFDALGPVTYVKATKEALKHAEKIRKENCVPEIILDWQQEDRCKTTYYKQNKKDKNVYEPLTCTDQGIDDPNSENQKLYFIVLFSYCPKIADQILSKEDSTKLH